MSATEDCSMPDLLPPLMTLCPLCNLPVKVIEHLTELSPTMLYDIHAIPTRVRQGPLFPNPARESRLCWESLHPVRDKEQP